jgi:hypothetical protein
MAPSADAAPCVARRQALGQDAGSTVVPTPSVEYLILAAKAKLAGKPPPPVPPPPPPPPRPPPGSWVGPIANTIGSQPGQIKPAHGQEWSIA